MPDFSPFPTTQAQIYFSDLDIQKAQIQVISSPQHGALVPGLHRDNMPYPSSDWDGAAYHPDAGYTGYDKFSMRVSDGKYSIVIYYNLQIFDGLPYANAANQDPWCIGQNFKISSIATGLSSIAQEDLTGAQIRYANLPGMALGQEESGTHSVVITLDETASGYGWFIDATPADNTEFLPTSNPNEWIAKADSAAAGKMDMLSVLLHEYGHALGLDHSLDRHDFMAPRKLGRRKLNPSFGKRGQVHLPYAIASTLGKTAGKTGTEEVKPASSQIRKTECGVDFSQRVPRESAL
ncbi:MAG: matrixin family metalloprotease [Rhodanobacter sp.]|nr:MAG: matrixin family metalloprotease [Rhodanobacter sp.]